MRTLKEIISQYENITFNRLLDTSVLIAVNVAHVNDTAGVRTVSILLKFKVTLTLKYVYEIAH